MTIPNEVGAIFGRRVREVRRRRDWSQAELSRRLAEIGHPMSQVVIARIEAKSPGSRALKVSLDDVVAIAGVLGVSPLFLFLPLEDDAVVSISPSLELPAEQVRAWVRGDLPLIEMTDEDRRLFETERDAASAGRLAAQKAARARAEEMMMQRQRESRRRKRNADVIAFMRFRDLEAEIEELRRRGQEVPSELLERHRRAEGALVELRQMTAEEWDEWESRRMDEQADYYADWAAEANERAEEEAVEEFLEKGRDT
jgi:transcriptional regulator with XRE-family HTH domain